MAPINPHSVSDYSHARNLQILFTDIDGTLTRNGQLPDDAYQAMWDLHRAGVAIVPVTGRSAGWCDLIARLWPARAVVGENGAFYFWLQGQTMKRHFVFDQSQTSRNQKVFQEIFMSAQKQFPRVQVASDQSSRICDFAIDFAEEISPPLSFADAAKIQKIFEANGAHAKVSSIHVNGWFGSHDKLTTCLAMCRDLLGLGLNVIAADFQSRVAFVGDSPNDEPMFKAFENSFAVSNIQDFWSQLQNHPRFVAKTREAGGFVEIANFILKQRRDPNFHS